ncbi:MAG: sugar porter family MFS transporter [Bacteroides sp.]|nr:sugar porter family MFS transporter [Bacteroides sp.]MDD2644980.1 sugar porter family MFS transporter [Bacteroides sp.]MDD4719621.1 sugar porter family MFS transporter [Bacteroides sp.]
MNKEVNLSYLIFISLVAALGGFLFGYDTAVISGTVTQVTALFQLDTIEQGWYVGCALVGSIIGVAVAGVLSDNIGRKKSMIISATLFTISAVGCALSGTFTELVVYRIIGGVGIGMVSIVSPLYISELSVAKYRGRLVSLYQLAITVGFLGAYLANFKLLDFSESGTTLTSGVMQTVFVSEVWRGMLGMEAIPAILFFIIIFFIPESPRWLLVQERREQASTILQKVFTTPDAVSSELNEIVNSLHTEVDSDWRILLKPGIFKAVLIGAAIAILGQFMGVNAVLYYGPTIFTDAGLSGGDSLFFQVFIGLVNMLTTILALLIIDKVGRKKLVYYGVTGMIFSLVSIGLFFIFGESLNLPYVLLLILFLLYIFFCAGSISAVVWVLLSEMYPTRIRGIAMSIAGFSLWIGTFLIGQLTPWMLKTLTPAGTFFLFAFMCTPYLYIMWKHVPETTGKSLEEIEKYWENQN